MRQHLFVERFLSKVVKGPTCWQWVGMKDAAGYGRCLYVKRVNRAHRVAWFLNRGPIPKNMHVLHTCDNRACVNPDHLYLGTHQQNIADRDRRGRTSRGEAHGAAVAAGMKAANNV